LSVQCEQTCIRTAGTKELVGRCLTALSAQKGYIMSCEN